MGGSAQQFRPIRPGSSEPSDGSLPRRGGAMTRRATLLSLLALGGCAPTMAAFTHEAADAELKRRLEKAVADQAAPGILSLLFDRAGEPVVFVAGQRDVERGLPMTRDTLFRIGSMTKPIVAVAALMLVEDGLLELDAPVERWLPELADRQVIRRIDGPLDDVYPSPRSITPRDLLSMKAGYTHPGLLPPGPLAEAQLASGTAAGATLNGSIPPDEWIARLARFPLTRPPGEAWEYQTPYEILGVLLRRAAGKPLETILEEHIFQPLDMTDTGFWVPPEKLERLAASYAVNEGVLIKLEDYETSEFRVPPVFPNAGGGLVSTADDYLKFARLLLQDGVVDGRRLLKTATVRLMTANTLTPAQRAEADAVGARTAPHAPPLFAAGGYGFGVSVATEVAPGALSPGAYGWDGLFGTEWVTDPTRGRISILLMQVLWGASRLAIGRDFKCLALPCAPGRRETNMRPRDRGAEGRNLGTIRTAPHAAQLQRR